MKRKSIINLFLFILITITFTLSYYKNIFHVVGPESFEDAYDMYCQSQVLGRVIQGEKEGILSEAGLNGWVRDDSIMKDMTWEEVCKFQYEIYKEEIKMGTTQFIIYDSQVGGQALFFAFLNKISPFSHTANLNLFWIITSLSMALLISAFVFWVSKIYGSIASMITFLFLLFSPMLTMLGNDLYVVLSSFYFPFITMLLLFYYESLGRINISAIKLFFISVVLISIKLFFSGFEFISTALVMFTVPMFYYVFLNRWKLKLFIQRFTSIILGSLSAIALYAILYAYQLSTLKGSLIWGFENMLSCFFRRTNGNSADFPEAFKASLDANLMDVLNMYLKSPALGFENYVYLTFKLLIFILIILSVLSFVPKKISPSVFKNRKINIVLIITTWISLLAPLSWFIIFKAHAYVHYYGYDDIVWCMPFALFVFAMIGSLSSSIIKDIYDFLTSIFKSKNIFF